MQIDSTTTAGWPTSAVTDPGMGSMASTDPMAGHVHPDGSACTMAMDGAALLGSEPADELTGVIEELRRAVQRLGEVVDAMSGGGGGGGGGGPVATKDATPAASTPTTDTPALVSDAVATTKSAAGSVAARGGGVSPDRDALVAQIRDLFVRRGSPMADSVEALVDTAQRHGIDPRIMVAIAGQESEFGTTNPESLRNNPFGFFWNGDSNSPFDSWEEGYERVATRLSEMINDQGFTSVFELGEGDPNVANDGYCEVGASNDPTGLNDGWIGGVSAMYRELGGDPEDVRA
jgi:hypothetical protein